MEKYTQLHSRKNTPQSQKIPGSNQVTNSAGGFSFPVDEWTRLDRFLILGSASGSYYANARTLTKENAENIEDCINQNGVATVNRIVEISDEGRAVKNDPAIFALAMCAKLGDLDTRKAAFAALPKVCRTGTHLFHFAEFVQDFGGWGRGLRNAVSNWYNSKTPDQLAYQLLKYKQRDGWSHRDLMRLAHPVPATETHNALFRHVTQEEPFTGVRLLEGVEELKNAQRVNKVVRLINEYNIPRECIPTQWLNRPEVWEALLQKMPMTAMIRNLGNMSKSGLLVPLSDAASLVTERLGDVDRLKKARIHPLSVLVALGTYGSGQSYRGSGTWEAVPQVIDALDKAFYASFKAVEPTNKRTMLALDISSSMSWPEISGMPRITPAVGSAAMALVTANVEPNYHVFGFSTRFVDLARHVSPRMRLDTVCNNLSRITMGGTDCAQPMLHAAQNNLNVDTFVVYTDSETWHGSVHPVQALQQYRQKTGIPAKLVVVGMVSNGFTIADPNDSGMLDCVGFDTATPAVISDFSRE